MTKTGSPSRSLSASLSVIPLRSTAYGPTGMPSAAQSFLVNSLSIAAAEAKTFAPTYGMSAISSMPWMVPSSPYAPCSTGKTTSTSASARGPSVGSSTIRPPAVGSARSTRSAPAAGGDLRQLARLDRQLAGVAAGQHPLALPGDADRHHLELVRVERAEHAAGADAGDAVLGAAAAEDDRHAGLAWGGHSGHLFATRLRLAVLAGGAHPIDLTVRGDSAEGDTRQDASHLANGHRPRYGT